MKILEYACYYIDRSTVADNARCFAIQVKCYILNYYIDVLCSVTLTCVNIIISYWSVVMLITCHRQVKIIIILLHGS